MENFRRGTLERWGLEPERLRHENPGLIVCTISAFSRDSSRAGEPGYDAMIQAAGGLMSITGSPQEEGGRPQKVGVAIADIMCGMYAATAIIAALHERSSSGGGQSIEVPLYDSQVAWLANQAMNFLVGGVVPGRLGTAHPNIVPYQAFATADGYLMIAVGNDRQFGDCMRCCGLPDLAGDARFRRNEDRLANRAELVALMSKVLVRESSAQWVAELAACGVPCSPINDIGEVFSSDYAKERGMVRTVSHAYDSDLPTVANPVRFSGASVDYRSAPTFRGSFDGLLRLFCKDNIRPQKSGNDLNVTTLNQGQGRTGNIAASSALGDVKYEIRGQLANHANELEKRGYEIISLNIGNPGLFGFRAPETMRLAMIENLGQAEAYCHQKGISTRATRSWCPVPTTHSGPRPSC